MPLGVIALLIDGVMTAAVGFGLLHKLNHTAKHVNEEIEKGVASVIASAPEILARAMTEGVDDGQRDN